MYPPRAAAAVPEAMVSFCENPGSRVHESRNHMPAAEVHGPVGRRARDGHDAASLDGELPGRKTAAGVDHGIGIKCLHLYERKKIGQPKQLP